MSYGVDDIEMYRRAAGYVHRILNGDKPAELPVQAAEVRTGRQSQDRQSTRPVVPRTLLVRADEVIE